MIQMWQKHQDWRQQDEADAAYFETEWRKANRAYKGRRLLILMLSHCLAAEINWFTWTLKLLDRCATTAG